MIKLMHFISGIGVGGAETLVKDYLLNFDKNRFECTLLYLRHHGDSIYRKAFKSAGIKMICVDDYLPFKSNANLFKKTVNKAARFYIVRKIIRQENPDIIHTHLAVHVYLKFAKPSKKTVLFHTVHSDPYKTWFSGRKGRKKDFNALKWLINHYKMKLIVLHQKMKTEVDSLFEVSDSIIMNNGVNIENYRTKRDKTTERKKLGIPVNSFVMGHVGRFADMKNHVFLVEVFKELKKDDKYLLMVGEGETKKDVVQKLRDYGLEEQSLILSNRDDVPEILSAMDVFVFPSVFEGLPLALIEAQETNLPCFISNNMPNRAVISNLVTPIALEEGPKKWSEIILTYRKPKRVVLDDEEWDIKTIVKRLESMYQDCITTKKHGMINTYGETKVK